MGRTVPGVATGRGGAIDISGDPREVDKVEVVARHEFDVHRVPVACGVDCPSDVACRARAVYDSALSVKNAQGCQTVVHARGEVATAARSP